MHEEIYSSFGCQMLANYRDDLVFRLTESLQQCLFDSRAFVRPSEIRRIAVQEADAFLAFLGDGEPASAISFGQELGKLGIGDEAVLKYGGILRRFCSEYADHQTAKDCLKSVEDYHQGVVAGFFRAREDVILREQERIRWALQQSLHRYTVHLETAAEVARVAISSLDLATLLAAVVDLIRQRLGLDYVAVYLVDDNSGYLVMRDCSCGSGEPAIEVGHRLPIAGQSTVARCLASRQRVISSFRDVRTTESETSWITQTQSEICLPLITHGRVIGVLSAQSIRSDKFSSQDVTGFQIMADQLASAIENARLFADARRRADDLAVAYEQLKELEQLKDQFMQNISHELRTPLTMIRGYAELLSTNQLGALDSDQLDAIDVILRYSNSLTVLVDDIMAIMDINTSRVRNQPVALAELINTSLLDFQVLASGAGVILTSEIAENDPQPTIDANPDHLRRIVENLIGNAVKFTPAGGKVQVQLETVDGMAIVEISDTGIGIPPEMVPHVFDRFFQVDGTRRRRYGGAGLGLALVKELAENYGGWVTADSPGIDRGATFRVALPVNMQ